VRSEIRPKLVSKKRTSGRRNTRSSIRRIRTAPCYRKSLGYTADGTGPTLSTLNFRYIAIEGPAGVGKSLLADRLGARLDAHVVLDETDNPFIPDFHSGRAGAGFQAQLFFTLARHRQQSALRQSDLFSQLTVCDYLFDRDKIYAYLNLDDNELFIYQRLYELLAPDMPSPDLVIYLQTPTDVLRRRLRERAKSSPDLPVLSDDYIRELNEAYNHFFFHYTATPLLVLETSHFDLTWGEEALTDLERQLRAMGKGTRYYVPRTHE
jgi:deoxyguanosine kinase